MQHIKIEDPGYIKDLMLADGLNLTTIELDEGEKIPNDLSKFGKWSLLFAWVPILGDPLTFVAGLLRVRFLDFVILVAIGKVSRYLVVFYLIS